MQFIGKKGNKDLINFNFDIKYFYYRTQKTVDSENIKTSTLFKVDTTPTVQ